MTEIHTANMQRSDGASGCMGGPLQLLQSREMASRRSHKPQFLVRIRALLPVLPARWLSSSVEPPLNGLIDAVAPASIVSLMFLLYKKVVCLLNLGLAQRPAGPLFFIANSLYLFVPNYGTKV